VTRSTVPLMRTTRLQRVDLNLLVALAVLLEERHVSRAADRIGLSQPATSRALQRLRDTLGDELLVRTRDGYQLTPRAERIQAELAQVVPRLEILFGGEDFDPAASTDRFRVAGTDYAATVLAPGLFRRLHEQAPGATLHFGTWDAGAVEHVARGLVDLTFYGFPPGPPVRSELLYEERFVCLLAADHPLADRDSLSLADFLGATHVLVEVQQDETPAIDRVLTGLGHTRRIALTVPYHSAAVLAVAGTSLVATLPARMLAGAVDPALRVVAAPAEIGTMPYLMVWHQRLDDDPAQRWLRDLVRLVAAEG
jgi:DNA-binding transcriptional LysR family regulator